MASIVDYLKQNKLPTDIGFRSHLYESLGLGTADEFRRSALTTGATNIKLLTKLQSDPALIGKLQAGVSLSNQPPPAAPATPTTSTTPAAPAAPAAPATTSLPSTTEEINQFQTQIAGLQSEVETEKQQAAALLPQVLKNPYSVESYLNYRKQYGVDDLEARSLTLTDTLRKTENDIREEVARTGGVATESQIQAMVADRQKPLLLEQQAITGQLNQKYQLLNTLQDLTGKSGEYTKQVYDSLVSHAKGDEGTVLKLMSDLLGIQKTDESNRLAQKRIDIEQQNADTSSKRADEQFAATQEHLSLQERQLQLNEERTQAYIERLNRTHGETTSERFRNEVAPIFSEADSLMADTPENRKRKTSQGYEVVGHVDGYVNPDYYISLRKQFAQQYPDKVRLFDDNFSDRLSPHERKRLGIGKSGLQSSVDTEDTGT